MAKVAIERLDHSRWSPPWTQYEHLARYHFATEFVDGKTVVDCACGDGTSTALFAAKAKLVYGFDVSLESIAKAQQTKQSSRAVFQQANATALPIEDRAADVFVSLETIEHVQQDEEFLGEVIRVLRDDGTFICSTPDRDVYSPGNTITGKPWNQFHVREYDASEFAKMLRARFRNVEFFGQNPTLPFLTELKCRLGRALSMPLVVRMNQVVKLRGFIWRRPERHRVVPAASNRKYEYLVAVCSGVLRDEG